MYYYLAKTSFENIMENKEAEDNNQFKPKASPPLFRYILIGGLIATIFAISNTFLQEFIFRFPYEDRIHSFESIYRGIFYIFIYSTEFINILIGILYSNVFTKYSSKRKSILFFLLIPLIGISGISATSDYYIVARFFGFFITVLIVNLAFFYYENFFKKNYPSFSTSIFFEKSIPDFEKEFLNKVRNVFKSDEFLTVLRTALPNGSKSKEYGFDFIPFMLHTVDERRIRFQKSSRNFLVMTIILGMFFSIILTFFAYLLLNEAAAGSQKTLVNLEEDTQYIRSLLEKVKSIESEYDIDKVIQPLINLPKGESSEATNKIKSYIASFSNYKTQANLDDLLIIMKENNESDKLKGLNEDSENIYKESIKTLEEFIENKETFSVTLPSEVKNLGALIQKADENLNKPENRIPDVIKRLFLSLALATFFIALLRYLVKLYRDHYQQLIIAEEDSLAIRKFYVAYKCSKDEDQRKAVLLSFMSNRNLDNIFDQKSEDKSSIEMNPDMLKEILSAITKKL